MGDFSRELCGGTHEENVGQVGLFKVIGEESVASGTRRITALTGLAAIDYVRQEEELFAQVALALRVPQGLVGDRVWPSLRRSRPSRSRHRGAARGRVKGLGRRTSVRRESIEDTTVVIQALENHSADEMRVLIDGMRKKKPSGLAVLLMTAAEGKVQLVAGLSSDLVSRGLHAGNWLKRSPRSSAAGAAAGQPRRPAARPRRRFPTPSSKP